MDIKLNLFRTMRIYLAMQKDMQTKKLYEYMKCEANN